MSGRRILNNLWILLVLIPLLPVVLHMSRKHPVYSSDEAGPLLQGRASFDSLLEASRGRTVLLNFWATWCTPCVEELPRIDMLYVSMSDSVVAIAVDLGDPDIETVVSFRHSLRLSMPMVWLSEEEAKALKSDWALPDLFPVTVVRGIVISLLPRSGVVPPGWIPSTVRMSICTSTLSGTPTILPQSISWSTRWNWQAPTESNSSIRQFPRISKPYAHSTCRRPVTRTLSPA